MLMSDFADCAEQKYTINKLLFSDVYLIEDPKERPQLHVNVSHPAAQSSFSLRVAECEGKCTQHHNNIKQMKAVGPDGVPGWGLKLTQIFTRPLAVLYICFMGDHIEEGLVQQEELLPPEPPCVFLQLVVCFSNCAAAQKKELQRVI